MILESIILALLLALLITVVRFGRRMERWANHCQDDYAMYRAGVSRIDRAVDEALERARKP
jgi:hypothetical protein